MDEQAKPSALKDKLIAITAIWLIIVAAGASGMPLQPSFGGAALSLTVYVLLLFAFSRFTTIGCRVGMAVFLGAVPLYLLACVIVALSIGFLQVSLDAAWLDLVVAGAWIGFVGWNGDPTIPGILLLLALNLLGPILVVIGLRDFALRKA